MLSTCIDCSQTLRAYWEFGLVRVVKPYFHGVLPLGNIWRRLLEFRNVVAWQILSYAIAAPDVVHGPPEDLAGIRVECNFDRLARLHIFEVLLEISCEQIAVCIRNKGGDAADPKCAGHHSRADLKVNDMTVLRRHQGGIIEIVSRQLKLRLHVSDCRVDT